MLMILAAVLGGAMKGCGSERSSEPPPKEQRTEFVMDTSGLNPVYRDSTELDDSLWVQHLLNWRDYKPEAYSGIIAMSRKRYFEAQADNRESNSIRYFSDWSRVYNLMSSRDQNRIPRVFSLYDSLLRERRPDRMEFANIIVSSVQDIPYSFVVQEPCEDFFRRFPDKWAEAKMFGLDCLGNTPAGVQSPAEFSYNLKGDCDTRSLFLYLILARYGYDCCIMVSEAYGHAVLGINLPMPGYSKNISGKRYVVWETTASGMQPGQLNPEFAQMDNWQIVLHQ